MGDDNSAATAEDNQDKYYRGIVCSLQRGSQRGTIRSVSGREIQFVFAHVAMQGSHRRFDDLYEGLHVGFDLSWTSKGLRVSVIRIPE